MIAITVSTGVAAPSVVPASTAVASAQVTTAPEGEVASTLPMSFGQLTVGPVLSRTVTVKVQMPVLPVSSAPVAVIVCSAWIESVSPDSISATIWSEL